MCSCAKSPLHRWVILGGKPVLLRLKRSSAHDWCSTTRRRGDAGTLCTRIRQCAVSDIDTEIADVQTAQRAVGAVVKSILLAGER